MNFFFVVVVGRGGVTFFSMSHPHKLTVLVLKDMSHNREL